jgi:surfactin synthase thioesterase subunit
MRAAATARVQLYCLPYAGAAARAFRPWLDLFPDDIGVWGVEYPGRGTRFLEPLATTIADIAAGLAAALADQPERPFALFGHSMGSLVAFETCHRLQALNAPAPVLLVASGHRAPHLPSARLPYHAAPDPDFIARVRDLGATPPEALASQDFLDLILPILRADFRACETYRAVPRPKLRIPTVIYGGLADRDVSRDQLEAWSHETERVCAVRMFPGDHFFLNSAADRVTGMLTLDLRKALSPA